MLKCILEFTIIAVLVLHCYRSCCYYLCIWKHGCQSIAELQLGIACSWICPSALQCYVFCPPS